MRYRLRGRALTKPLADLDQWRTPAQGEIVSPAA